MRFFVFAFSSERITSAAPDAFQTESLLRSSPLSAGQRAESAAGSCSAEPLWELETKAAKEMHRVLTRCSPPNPINLGVLPTGEIVSAH